MTGGMTLNKSDCVQIMEMYQEIKLLCLLRDMGIIDEEEYRGVPQMSTTENSFGRCGQWGFVINT